MRKNSGKSIKYSCRADGEFEDKRNRTGSVSRILEEGQKRRKICLQHGGIYMNRKRKGIREFHGQAIDNHLREKNRRAD